MPRISWKKPGYYEKLGEVSLEDWLRANHLGRAPSELVAEISTIVGHQAPLSSVQHACQRLKLYTSRASRTRVYSAASRVRARDPVPEPDLDALWEKTKALAVELKKHSTKTSEIEIDFRDEERPIAVVTLADLHLGSAGVDYSAIERDSELIARTDGMYAVAGGDAIDNFIVPSLLAGMASQAITASAQWSLLERYLGTIQDKVLYATVGNHDDWTRKVAQVDKFGEMVGKFGILDVGHIGVAHMFVGKQEYVAQHVHRFWSRSRLNPLWPAMRLLDHGIAPDADVNVVQHEHSPAAGWFNRRGKHRVFIRTGSYKTKDDYAYAHGFYDSEIAPAVVVYFPEEHRIHVLHGVPEASQYITYLRSK